MSQRDFIVVGVDGSVGSTSAIGWAAREAERLGIGLRLAHVCTGYYAAGGLYAAARPSAAADEHRIFRAVLDQATGEAQAALPADQVETMAIRADARAGLLEAAAGARMLVVGDEAHPAITRIITGSVIAAVAAHAWTPVVAVPANWDETQPRDSVVVGVKDCRGSAELVRQAFELAAVRRTRLIVTHGWELRAQYDGVVATHGDLPSWEERMRADLGDLVVRATPSFADPETEIRLVHAQPARALIDASVTADLLVIARRPHGLPFGHLGATGRAVLRGTRCPTMVLPPVSARVDLPAAPDTTTEPMPGAATPQPV